MKRFRVVLLLVGGLALGSASVGAEVIRGGNAAEKRVVNAEFSKQVVKQPAHMATPRGDRFQKKAPLAKHVVVRKISGASGKIIRHTDQKSSANLRTFPVMKIGTSVTR